MASLLKYIDEGKPLPPEAQRLHWGRVKNGDDPFPFRGPPPMATEEEYEATVCRVADAKNGFFDVTIPAENKAYLDVIDRVMNGWYKLITVERFWVDPEGKKTTKHYVEWLEYYLEDGTKTHAAHYSPLEVIRGNS